MKLRSYQQEAVDAIQKKLETDRCALVATCVGSGKSLIISETAKKYNRAVVIQPAQELVVQNYNKFVGSGLDCTMIYSQKKGDWDADFIFTTPQTLAKNIKKVKEPDIIFADEVQWGYIGMLWKTIRANWKKCKMVGLTATPRYYEQKVVYSNGWMYSKTTCKSLAEDIFGPPVIEISRDDLRALGYGRDIKIEKVRITKVENYMLENLSIYEPIIQEHILELGELLKNLKNGLIYCTCQKHAELLNVQSKNKIRLMLGKTNKKEREQLIADFLEDKVKFIATVGCGRIGLDLPNLTSIIILTDVGNADLLEQMIGRLNRGECDKTCYYSGTINQKKPIVGQSSLIKVKKIGGKNEKI